MSQSDDRLFYFATQLERGLMGFHKARLNRAGLEITPAQSAVLFILAKEDALAMKQVAEALSMDNAALTRMADRLEKAGLISRQPHPQDRRACLLSITKQGRTLAKKAAQVTRQANQDLKDSLSQAELKTLFAAGNKLLARCAKD